MVNKDCHSCASRKLVKRLDAGFRRHDESVFIHYASVGIREGNGVGARGSYPRPSRFVPGLPLGGNFVARSTACDSSNTLTTIAMINVVPFRKPKPSEKARGKTLCREGFHKWRVWQDKQFDVKLGRLVTVYVCARCGAHKMEAR